MFKDLNRVLNFLIRKEIIYEYKTENNEDFHWIKYCISTSKGYVYITFDKEKENIKYVEVKILFDLEED